jgi:HlyD family secretion protein
MSNVTGVQQARDRVLQMARQIEELSQSPSPPETFFPEFLRLLVASMGARAGAIWLAEAGRLKLAHELRYADIGIRENPNAVRLNDSLINDAVTTGQAASFSPDDPAMAGKMPVDFLIIVAALQIGEDCVGAVEIFQRADAPREARPGFLQFVEQMTGHASRFLERRQTASTTSAGDVSGFLADFEQFILQLQRGENVPEIAATAANDGRQLLGCDRLSIAVHKGKKTSIVAISGQDSVNARANLTRAMAAIAARIVELREPLTFSGRIENLPPQIEEPLANFIHESGSRLVKLLPLIEPEPLIHRGDAEDPRPTAIQNREVIGCLVIEQTADSRPRPRLEERSHLLADHVGAVLAHARRQDRILFLRLWQKLGYGLEWFHGRKLAKTLAILGAAAAVVAALCFVPWEYRVVGKGKLMPIRRREVFAPENGEVIKIAVIDQEKVHKGQLLLQLRNEQLSAELHENETKLSQALQRIQSYTDIAHGANKDDDRKAFLQADADREKAKLEADGLMRILTIQRERVDKLTVISPIDGTVAGFQLEQLLQNRPVQQGELLLEVMDETGAWRLELEVEGSRMGHVLRAWNNSPDHKLAVDFIPATAAESTFQGELVDIASRSAVSTDQTNIFECLVSIDAKEIKDKRIGAEVRAKISCGKRSLGYVLFGDVIEFIRQRLWL